MRLTRDLSEYGKKQGHVLFESFADGKIHSIPVPWAGEIEKPILQTLEEGMQKRMRVAIEYISSENGDGLGFRKSRLIDIHHIKPNGEIEAYCHLRKGLRDFRLSRIAKAELTEERYALAQDAQASLF